jgi:hypothetical protein
VTIGAEAVAALKEAGFLVIPPENLRTLHFSKSVSRHVLDHYRLGQDDKYKQFLVNTMGTEMGREIIASDLLKLKEREYDLEHGVGTIFSMAVTFVKDEDA